MGNPAKQADKVVLLVRGDVYFELLSKTDDRVEIMDPVGRQAAGSISALHTAGFAARAAFKLVKTDGSWMYMAPGAGGVDLYQAGKLSPAMPSGARSSRTL